MQLQIKNQTFAKRCEVCHLSDCYDSEKNYCSRCFTALTSYTKVKMSFLEQLVFFIVINVTVIFLLAMTYVYSDFSSLSKQIILNSLMFIDFCWIGAKVTQAVINGFFLKINLLTNHFKKNKIKN